MTQPFSLVDAFTDQPFAGNPAAVYFLPAWREDAWLQHVAREMNQAETAFLIRNAEGFDLRWFTPTVEVDLCGHATLASAHVLWEGGHIHDETIWFTSRSGKLSARRRGSQIELDFPLTPERSAEAPADLLESLGTAARYIGRSQFDYLVEVESEDVLRNLKPDITRLARLPVRGVIVTARSSSPEFDFVSRFFAPAAGVNEDPVTGSAHCCLADFWRRRLGKDTFRAFQASERGGKLTVEVRGERVLLVGSAVTVARGELVID